MTYKVVIESSKLKEFKASISIYDEKGGYVDGYYATELVDKRNTKDDKGGNKNEI